MKLHSLTLALLTLSAMALPPMTGLAAETDSTDDWQQLITGKNLGLGKEMILAPSPTFRKTTSGNEIHKLTDGKWKDETLPHSKNAVGWAYLHEKVQMILDLGEEQPIGNIVARFQGGEGDRTILLPRQVVLSLSVDGKNYYEAASLTKVTGGESELATQHPDRYIYRPEIGQYFIHPYTFKVDRVARYVALTVTPGLNNVFSDEVFVMASERPDACRTLEGLERSAILSKGIEVRPKSGEAIYISTNVITPNYFYIADRRPSNERASTPRIFLDLPDGIDLKMGWKGTASRDPDAPEGTNRWIIENLWNAEKPDWQGAEGPVYFIVRDGVTLPGDATLVLSSDEANSGENKVTVPIKSLTIPAVPPLKEVEVSLTWMSEEDHAYLYPDFFNSFKHFGFTAVGTFPRNAQTPEQKERLRNFAGEVRKNGLGVVYNESAFNVMVNLFGMHPEIFHQIDGKAGKQLCPTYTGPYYRKEIARVAESARLVQPNIVYHDTELWYRGVQERKQCSRCKEAFKASGMDDWEAFFLTQGTRMTKDLHDAVAGTRPDGGNPIAGNYNVVADPPIYHEIYEFKQLYPDYFDFGMPVLYVRGDIARIHETIRRNHQATGTRDVVPWLTAGTYGEFPPVKVEQMILETLLNGARGFTYYRFQDHDPLDYYHQAVALSLIAPYQHLLKNGSLLPVNGTSDQLKYTAWGDDKEALLLVGDYRDSGDAIETTVSIKGAVVTHATDLKAGQPLKDPDTVTLQLRPGEQRLLHVIFQANTHANRSLP